jgi:dihydroorotase
MILLQNAVIVTSVKEAEGSILIDGDRIAGVFWSDSQDYAFCISRLLEQNPDIERKDLTGKHIMAGGIDPHVHFREPGLTHKADMASESRAAVAGGVTTVIDMPNTKPVTTGAKELKEKISLAEGRCAANIFFHIGATNSNHHDLAYMARHGCPEEGIKAEDIAGIKVFMGSSTGNMLVNDNDSLVELFSIREKPILVHCEDEDTIRKNLENAKAKYGDDIPFSEHRNIRSRMACIRSTIKALELAIEHQTRLVLCHISTMEEIEMARAAKISNPDIVTETSCNYLWFSDEAYNRLGSRVKCNPAVKAFSDKQSLRNALRDGLIDIIGSDHAPHLLSEKEAPYCLAPSGLPSIQQTLPVLLTVAEEECIPLTRIASVFSEKASEIYGMKRGKIKEGYFADLVVFDYEKTFVVKAEDQLSKCGWSPYEGETLKGVIESVFVNGKEIIS